MVLVGETLPDTGYTTSAGAAVDSLHEELGGDWGLVFAFPSAYDAVSTTELGELARIADKFAARKVKIIALTCDGAEAVEGWLADVDSATGSKPEFAIVCDGDRSVSAALGVLPYDEKLSEPPIPLSPARTCILVDPAKKVQVVSMNPVTTGRSSFELLRVIDAVQRTADHSVDTPVNWTPGRKVLVQEGAEAAAMPIALPSEKGYLKLVDDPSA